MLQVYTYRYGLDNDKENMNMDMDMDDPSKDLIPTEDEINALLSLAQTNPTKLPAAMLQIQTARLVSTMLMRMAEKVSKEADKLQKSTDKVTGKNLDNDVPK